MPDYDFFLSSEEYVNNYTFLNIAFDKIEQDFLDYFDYVPLESKHLKVSSMRLADLILRVFPLLGIAFRTITFGKPMRAHLEHLEFEKSPLIEKIVNRVSRLSVKQLANKDNERDYHKLLCNKIMNDFIVTGLLSDATATIRPRAGRIHWVSHIQPFQGVQWNEIIEIRNAIAHRGKITATIEEAINTLACLALLLESNANNQGHEYPLPFESEIFMMKSFSMDDWRKIL